jgi:hypothetical protein
VKPRRQSEPTKATLKRLFLLTGNRCAFPNCKQSLLDATDTLVGDVCHIKGERPTAKRYDPTQNEKDRHGFDNLIVLCKTHHGTIDGNEAVYTVEVLTDMKRLHDAQATARYPFRISDETAERILAQMSKTATVAAVAGGAIAGFEIVEQAKKFAKTFGELLGFTASRSEPKLSRTKRVSKKSLIELLRYAPLGTLLYASDDARHLGFGEVVAAIFKEAGWRVEATDMGLASPEIKKKLEITDRLLLHFVLRDQNLVPNAGRAVDEFFTSLGFQREDDGSGHVGKQGGQVIRILLGFGVQRH